MYVYTYIHVYVYVMYVVQQCVKFLYMYYA